MWSSWRQSLLQCVNGHLLAVQQVLTCTLWQNAPACHSCDMSRLSLGTLFVGGVPFRSRNTYWDSGLGWRPSGLTTHPRGCRRPGPAGGDWLFPKPGTHERPLTMSAHGLPTVSAARGQSSRTGQFNHVRLSLCGCRRNCTSATAHVNPNRNHQTAPRVVELWRTGCDARPFR